MRPSTPSSDKHLPPKPEQIPSLATPSIRRRFPLRFHPSAIDILRGHRTHSRSIRDGLLERAFDGLVRLRGGVRGEGALDGFGIGSGTRGDGRR